MYFYFIFKNNYELKYNIFYTQYYRGYRIYTYNKYKYTSNPPHPDLSCTPV